MTIKDALKNALELLESLGYTSGAIVDDLQLALDKISKFPKVANTEL